MKNKIKFYNEFLNEKIQSLIEHDGILVIVDVQKEFEEYIPQGFVEKLKDYCKEFPIKNPSTQNKALQELQGTYQIYDTNKAEKVSYAFPNQVETIKKNYGMYTTEMKLLSKKLLSEYKNLKEGDIFKIKDKNEYLVKIVNNHDWFFVNEDLANLFSKLKNRNVILVGGADNECLKDVYIAMKSFKVNPIYNHEYIYSSKTSNDQIVND